MLPVSARTHTLTHTHPSSNKRPRHTHKQTLDTHMRMMEYVKGCQTFTSVKGSVGVRVCACACAAARRV